MSYGKVITYIAILQIGRPRRTAAGRCGIFRRHLHYAILIANFGTMIPKTFDIMRRLIISMAAALCVCMAAQAQQALWSRSNAVSPQVNDDGSVTFRLVAPGAGKVVVAGDFTAADGKDAGRGEMTRGGNGVWEYTTPPLASELYSYSFVVDGVKICDPSNVYINRDVASVANILIVGGGRGDLYRVNDVPHGSVTRCWYDSPTLGSRRRMTVYTPAGYEQGKEKYPVLYLLHGAGGDEEAWMTLGRTSQIMDNLIAGGKCRPMIVVMTNGNAWQQAAPGESPEGMRQPAMRYDPTQSSFEEAFGDVMAYVERNYRTIRKKEARAVAGLSMGGGHSFNISRMYPDRFDYVGLFSAAVRGVEDPEVAASLAVQRDKGFRLYWIACGDTDFLYEANRNYMKYLDSIGFPYVYRESDGGHIWRNWRIYLSEFAPMLFVK